MASEDIENVREHLEQLLNETEIKSSIRKQIVRLHERNRTHKKRINIENRVIKNLKSHGVLEKIIDHLASSESLNSLSGITRDPETESHSVQPASIAKNIDNLKQSEENPVHSKIVPCSRDNKSCSSLRNVEISGNVSRTNENKTHNTKSSHSNKEKKLKEKSEKKKLPKPPKMLVEKDKHSVETKIPEIEITKHTTDKGKHKGRKLKTKFENALHYRNPNDITTYTTDYKNALGETHEDKSNKVLVKINPRKRHLHFEILHGKAFLDHLLEESYSMFTLFLHFRGQRFWTQPISCKSQPEFDAGFLYELHTEELGDSQMAHASQLLNIDDKIHIVLARILPSGEKVLVSSHYFEWRQILFAKESQKTFTVELLGVGAESNITVGAIDVRITLIPKLAEKLSEKVVLSRIQVEKRKQEEQDRIFLVYAKAWWKEYLSLRPEHAERMVKIFHQDENSKNRPVFQFIQVLKVGRPLLELPQEAAWFVSLIQLELPSLLGAVPTVEQWCVPHTFLCIKRGGSENHASLLCSLFLGFGLDAYVCIGTKEDNIPWAWVATIGKEHRTTFWESTTGARYGHDAQLPSEPYRSSYTYKTVGCVFNHKCFYANVQESDQVKLCNFNIGNRRLWKNLSEAAISSAILNLKLSLMPGWTEPFLHSQEIETELRARITAYRQDLNLPVRWDVDMCHLIAPVLALYEMEHRMGLALRKQEIDDLISKNVPEGFAFRALPIRVAAMDKQRVLGVCLQNTIMKSIVTCPEPGCKLALRVHTYVYPENILSIWLIIACKFRSE